MSDYTDTLSERVRNAARLLFGDTPLAATLTAEADRFQRDVASLESLRGVAVPTIAMVGPSGHGKSAIVRTLIRDPAVQEQIRSGPRPEHRTQKITWVGPYRPDDLHPGRERHVPATAAQMVSLGKPYLLIDTPSFSSQDPARTRLAEDVLADAQVHALVVKRERIESADVLAQVNRSGGATVLPIVRVRDRDEAFLAEDVADFFATLRADAAGEAVLPPVVVPDTAFVGDAVWPEIQQAVARALSAALRALPDPRSVSQKRIQARTHRFFLAVQRHLGPIDGRVRRSSARFEDEIDALTVACVRAVLGNDRILKAGIRGRLRSDLSEHTLALWFPFRPCMNLVQLTYGAWDQLIMGMAGSIPSWLGTIFAAGRQLRDAAHFEEATAGLQERLTVMATDRLRPLLVDFDHALQENARADGPNRGYAVRMVGLSELQAASDHIIDDAIHQHRLAPLVANLAAAAGTAMFWALFSPPIISLYRHYFTSSAGAFRPENVPIDAFPAPPAALWLTSFLLSAIPLLLFTIVYISVAVGPKRVQAAADQIRQGHDDALRSLKNSGVLALKVADPRVEAARFLFQLEQPPALPGPPIETGTQPAPANPSTEA
ncbi:MAG: hypothetical protein AAFV53_16410 [Myxococcota bacterium]